MLGGDSSGASGRQTFGEANAAAFDERGWPYFTGEDFDLYYPGYGDSWPSFFGATGMTYEQAGGGEAGVVLARPGDRMLTLTDRVSRHLTAALVTIATAVEKAWRARGRTGSAHLVEDGTAGAAVLALRDGGTVVDDEVFGRLVSSLAALR